MKKNKDICMVGGERQRGREKRRRERETVRDKGREGEKCSEQYLKYLTKNKNLFCGESHRGRERGRRKKEGE